MSRFLEKALSVAALGKSLRSSEGKVSNRNYRRTSPTAINKQNSSQTISTETQTNSGKYCCNIIK